jgi:hypothetical protein
MIDNVLEDGSVDTSYGDVCRHGTYIGTPGGADFMCGWCEDGTPWDEFVAYRRERRCENMRNALKQDFFSNCWDWGVWRLLRNSQQLERFIHEAADEIESLNFDELSVAVSEYLGWEW